MNFRKSRTLMWVGLVIGIFIMALGIGIKNEYAINYFMIIGSVIFLVALIQAFVFYICPHCGYSLMNVRGEVPEHCPKCGKEL